MRCFFPSLALMFVVNRQGTLWDVTSPMSMKRVIYQLLVILLSPLYIIIIIITVSFMRDKCVRQPVVRMYLMFESIITVMTLCGHYVQYLFTLHY